MKQLIAKKLIVSFIIAVIISGIAGMVGLILLNTLDKGYGEALVSNGFVQGDIGDYNTYINKGGALVRDVIMLTDAADIKEAQAELEVTKKLTTEALEAARVHCQTPEELEMLAKIDAAAPKYTEASDRAVELGLQNKNDEALQVFREEARPYLLECVAGIDGSQCHNGKYSFGRPNAAITQWNDYYDYCDDSLYNRCNYTSTICVTRYFAPRKSLC